MSRRGLLVLSLLVGVLCSFFLTQSTPVGAQGEGANIVEIPELEDLHAALPDFDTRTAVVNPSASQLNMVSAMGATARWNRFGTPHSLIKYGDFLATGLSGEPAIAAREWVRANRNLFRLTSQSVTRLELVSDIALEESGGHVVLFRQRFGDLAAVQDGMLTVAIKDGNIAYVSSSITGNQVTPPVAVLTPVQAWLAGATNVELPVSLAQVSNVRTEYDWTVFDVVGFSHPQRARLRALPMPGSAPRPVFEVNVVNMLGGGDAAYTLYVDAVSGNVLFRQSRLNHAADDHIASKASSQFVPVTETFTGTYTEECGPFHDFDVPEGTTRIVVSATTVLAANDIVLYLYQGADVVASQDTATSPEAIVYTPAGGVEAGLYRVQVCPYESAPPVVLEQYVGTFTTDDSPLVEADLYNPMWRYFTSNPPQDYSTTDSRILGCWTRQIYTPDGPQTIEECDVGLRNAAARYPWDYNTLTETPNDTTIGNSAISATSWASPLTPAEQYRPVSPTRVYDYPWTNQWYESDCNPTVFASPQANDRDAATVNLFVAHNRMHDWSYRLGFKEETYNAQANNFGNTPPSQQNDAETGNVQAGAVSGGAPSYLGRDNANQVTLQDGIPPITNMYLWQPIAGAFYAPCVDGDYDMSVIGHEYTHLISNRMVGGPDSNLTGLQAGAMGESWADLTAAEYLNEYSYVPLNEPSSFVVGGYVTGNPNSGIRNYNMATSPLNYSDVGYDMTGPQVHADGEIWSATNYAIRQLLIEKYNGEHSASSEVEQRHCADGEPVEHCPGNRRWMQIVFDAWLLMPPSVSMLDARDAYLAADMMLFDGANQTELWLGFARRGMGLNASSNGAEDNEPVPNFESPAQSDEVQLVFKPLEGTSTGPLVPNVKIYVGKYEARATPIADTDPNTPLSDRVRFVPGTYEFLMQAPGFGLHRFTYTINAGGSGGRQPEACDSAQLGVRHQWRDDHG